MSEKPVPNTPVRPEPVEGHDPDANAPGDEWNCGNHYLRQQWLFTLVDRNPAIATSMPAQDELELIANMAGPAMCRIAIDRWLGPDIEVLDSEIPF